MSETTTVKTCLTLADLAPRYREACRVSDAKRSWWERQDPSGYEKERAYAEFRIAEARMLTLQELVYELGLWP